MMKRTITGLCALFLLLTGCGRSASQTAEQVWLDRSGERVTVYEREQASSYVTIEFEKTESPTAVDVTVGDTAETRLELGESVTFALEDCGFAVQAAAAAGESGNVTLVMTWG